jgi:hypothetical protein
MKVMVYYWRLSAERLKALDLDPSPELAEALGVELPDWGAAITDVMMLRNDGTPASRRAIISRVMRAAGFGLYEQAAVLNLTQADLDRGAPFLLMRSVDRPWHENPNFPGVVLTDFPRSMRVGDVITLGRGELTAMVCCRFGHLKTKGLLSFPRIVANTK